MLNASAHLSHAALFPQTQVVQTSFFVGPNRWFYEPTLEHVVDIGILENYPSNTIPGFYDRLIALLPGLETHRCNYGVHGGFLMRLREGTWTGHVLEHVALELQTLCGLTCGRGKTRETTTVGVYFLAFSTPSRVVGEAIFDLANTLVYAAMNNIAFDVQQSIRHFKNTIMHHNCLGSTTQALVNKAKEKEIPVITHHTYNLVQFGYGVQQRRIWSAVSDATSAIGIDISSNKQLTKELLRLSGVSTPTGTVVRSLVEAKKEVESIGFPVCVKPLNANQRRGVVLDIRTEDDLEKAFFYAQKYREEVIIESFVPGITHRLLVVGDTCIAAHKSGSVYVIGNGHDTINTLIENQIENNPKRGRNDLYSLPEIHKDERLLLILSAQNMSLDSIPDNQQRIIIFPIDGDYTDCTANVHPTTAEQAILAARILQLDIAGIDLVALDISQPLHEQNGAIVEVNARPNIFDHIEPTYGSSQPVGKAIIDHLFPTAQSSIPLVSLSGSTSEPYLAHFIGYMLHHSPSAYYTGVSTQHAIYYNGIKNHNNYTIAEDQRAYILTNPLTQAAVIETSYEDLLRRGIPHQYATLSILTDISPIEHLGKNYITTPQQLHDVFRTVIDIVRTDGYAILNANNPESSELAALCDGTVIMFSHTSRHPDYCSVWLDDKHIVIADKDQSPQKVFAIKNIEALALSMTTILCSIASARALNIPMESFTQLLQGFMQVHGKKGEIN